MYKYLMGRSTDDTARLPSEAFSDLNLEQNKSLETGSPVRLWNFRPQTLLVMALSKLLQLTLLLEMFRGALQSQMLCNFKFGLGNTRVFLLLQDLCKSYLAFLYFQHRRKKAF